MTASAPVDPVRPHHGRHYLVVGGAGGIGLALAREAARQGAVVCVADVDEAALRACAAEPGLQRTVHCDVGDPAQIERMVQQAATHLDGRLHALIVTAGIDLRGPLHTLADADWERVLTINLTAAMRLSRACLPILRATRGDRSMVFLSSAAGLSPLPERSAYCVSKAGLVMLGKCLAQELGPEGIRVLTVAPGAVDTPLLHTSYAGVADPAQARAQIRARYALERIAAPEEVAWAVLYLCSPLAAYVTGTTLAVDGGRSFH
ncbi:SDR family NAD(P)-dependent oxidoreductase [Castellaniella sp.]|uniref:SDR family NAD(P)-dependent oxidoreductase n=1 Tax=Castellaniella sp. TaxID=1955812 RepID=UPI003563BC6F